MKTIFTLLLATAALTVSAQDTIITTSGEMIPAMVKNISTTEIEYKKAANPDGPTYVRAKTEVIAIHYKNGSVDKFASTGGSKTAGGDDYYSAGQARSNSTSLTMSDVHNTSAVVFYGVDFTNFSLIESKREDESDKIKNEYFPEWNSLYVMDVPAKTLARWLKKPDMTYSVESANKLNKTANVEKVVSGFPPQEDMKQNIKTTVAALADGDTHEKGIGLIINVEYFFKARQETAVYFTWFDIATHAVISSERVVVKKVQTGGLTKFWSAGLVEVTKEYVDNRFRRY